MKTLFLLTAMIFWSVSGSQGQTVNLLISNYSGNTDWDNESGTLVFTSSGSIDFDKADFKNFIWDVPAEVKTIVINENVTVNGAFHTYYHCTIRGKNRHTSVIFGTNEQSWSKNRRDEGFTDVRAFNYSAIEAKSGTTYIQNLTSLNPYGFHVRGGMLHLLKCDFIDNRGGHGNNSDGFVGSDGSTVDSCYFETGDDIIKLYNNITVSNTTIHMIDNSVPIQLGWGNTGNKTGYFINLTITGNSGRFNDGNAIIVGRDGVYTKTIHIDGCNIQNPTASWISLRVPGQVVKGEATDAFIGIKQFWSSYREGSYQMTICGTNREGSFYNCSGTSFPVSFEVAAGNGSLTASTGGKPISSGEYLSEGSNLLFRATPDEGNRVKEWQWNGTVIENNTGNEFSLDHLYAPAEVTVEFEEITSSLMLQKDPPVLVYPNPAREMVNIAGLKPGADIRIFGPAGTRVFHQATVSANVHFPLKGFSSGMYIICIRSGNETTRGKLIIE